MDRGYFNESINEILTHLFSPCFITDRWSEMYLVSISRSTVVATHQNTQTRLLQNHSIVVVRVAHGPSTNVTSGVLDVMTIDVAAVTVWPLFILIKVVELLNTHGMKCYYLE